jgi:hypothetical protein
MMMLDSITVRSPSRSRGMRRIGHSAVNSASVAASSGVSMRHSNGMPFSYNAINTFWQ